jgi:hypothetical protein
MFKAYKSHLIFILFSILIYLLNPIVTEFAQFGGILLGLQKFSPDNTLFSSYLKEFSSQIVLSSFMTNLFKFPLIVEFFGGAINATIATTAVYQWIKLFDHAFKVKKSNQRIFLVIAILTILQFSLDLSYPIKFPLSYAVFGNSGMWLSIMILGMILRRKIAGYIFLGILISWHVVWAFFTFLAILSAKDLFFQYKLRFKETILALSLGLTVSTISYFFFIFINGEIISHFDKAFRLASLIEPVILNKIQLTRHNVGLLDYSSFFKIIVIIFFGLYFIKNLKKIKKSVNINFYKRLILIFSIIGFGLTFYVALASYIPLIGADVLARLIPNRIFNILIVLNSILVIYFLLLVVEQKIIRNIDYMTSIIIISWLVIAHYISGVIVALTFLFIIALQNIKKLRASSTFNALWQKTNKLFLCIITVLFFSKLVLLNRHYYTIYDYLFQENEIIRELKKIDPKNSRILVGPGIPPAHGFNIYLATHTEFIAHAHDIGKPFYYINTITKCGKINEDLPGFKYYLDWQCMASVDTLAWKQINLQTSITHVLMKNDKKLISLKLPVVGKSKHFILYSLKKN